MTTEPGARHGGATSTFGTPFDVNWLGLWTLYRKEVQRFFKVITQTVLAPVVTTLLFLAIFSLALGRGEVRIGELAFVEFLAPGLIMMAIIQNAFANTSSSIGIAKVQGNIVDYLMPPLSAGELVFGVAMGGVTRGVIVGVVVWLTMIPFVGVQLAHPSLVPIYVLSASLTLSLLGLLTALWADKFDQMAAVTNFVITPLSFLSGTFYSVDRLPDGLGWVAHLNPFFYMIDGLRFALTGHADGNVVVGLAVLLAVNLGLWLFTLRLVRRGYNIRP
ncbi:MAG: multidrug ABC transporter permease [Geminicoccaceae bacterium]|nr:MAG: multidrug ABC transporter permease [Geminicoccaceae bacterium]